MAVQAGSVAKRSSNSCSMSRGRLRSVSSNTTGRLLAQDLAGRVPNRSSRAPRDQKTERADRKAAAIRVRRAGVAAEPAPSIRHGAEIVTPVSPVAIRGQGHQSTRQAHPTGAAAPIRVAYHMELRDGQQTWRSRSDSISAANHGWNDRQARASCRPLSVGSSSTAATSSKRGWWTPTQRAAMSGPGQRRNTQGGIWLVTRGQRHSAGPSPGDRAASNATDHAKHNPAAIRHLNKQPDQRQKHGRRIVMRQTSCFTSSTSKTSRPCGSSRGIERHDYPVKRVRTPNSTDPSTPMPMATAKGTGTDCSRNIGENG